MDDPTAPAPTWEQEFTRRVTQQLTPEHYGHGFRPERVAVSGSDGARWSSHTWEDAAIAVAVAGVCPCGAQVNAYESGPEDVADLLRKITEPAVPTAQPVPPPGLSDRVPGPPPRPTRGDTRV